MVALRMDRRLQGRIDASDILQEALVDAAKRIGDFNKQDKMSFYVWLRWITGEKLLNEHRRHLGVQMRDANREVSIYRRAMPAASSFSIARHLLGQLTSPTQAAAKTELKRIIQKVLEDMDSTDREILVLRNFEELSTTETAEVLGLKRSTAAKRYLTALKRLRQALDSVPGMELYLK